MLNSKEKALFRRLDVERPAVHPAADQNFALARVIDRAHHALALHLLDQRRGLVSPAMRNQCGVDFDNKLITATPAIINAMPIIAGASKL